MGPRICTALVAAQTVVTLSILSVGLYSSLRVRAERAAYYEGVEEEIRRLGGQNPAREAVLRDDLLESLYFGEQAAGWYFLTLLLSVPTLAVSFFVCCVHTGPKKQKMLSWLLWGLSALLVLLFGVHNLI